MNPNGKLTIPQRCGDSLDPVQMIADIVGVKKLVRKERETREGPYAEPEKYGQLFRLF